jgi:hypothetical protein
MSVASEPQDIKALRSRFIRVSSEDKVDPSGSNSRFTIDLESAGGLVDSVAAISVHSAQCPNIFPNIAATTNTLQIIDGAAVAYLVTIPPDFYSATALMPALQAAINAVIAPRTVVITLVGSAPSQRFRFTFSVPFTMVSGGVSTIAPALGLTATFGPGFVLNMPDYPNLIGETEVYIHSRTLSQTNLMDGVGSFSVLDKIPLNVAFGNMAYLDVASDKNHYTRYIPYQTLKSLRTIAITLRNRNGDILELPPNFFFTMMIVAYMR